MRGLLFFAAFVLARSYTPPTCSECVITKGMSWQVIHRDSIVVVGCVPTKDCQEESNKMITVMCYSENCDRMPDTSGNKWWYEGSDVEDRCPPGANAVECLRSDRNKCAWVVKSINNEETEFCMFRTFALQQKVFIVCPRHVYGDDGETQRAFQLALGKKRTNEIALGKKETNEIAALEDVGVPTTCGECVAEPGYAWNVHLFIDRTDGPSYTLECVPSKDCKEIASDEDTNLCYPLHCDKLHSTKQIFDWWASQTQKYEQCAPLGYMEHCVYDDECTYVAQKNHWGVSGFCTFKMFADNFNLPDECGDMYNGDTFTFEDDF